MTGTSAWILISRRLPEIPGHPGAEEIYRAFQKDHPNLLSDRITSNVILVRDFPDQNIADITKECFKY